jgi:tetratricopeptide (TPR) repeat protein
MEYERGNYAAAIPFYQRAVDQQKSSWGYLRLGRTYLGAGSIGKAVEMLEKAQSRYDGSRFYAGTQSARMHYWLGQGYEASGWRTKAIEQYETFLHIWKDADPEILILDDARERLAKLKGSIG